MAISDLSVYLSTRIMRSDRDNLMFLWTIMKQNERDLKFTDWQSVSEQHQMKPHAAKMRFLRIRKQLEEDETEALARPKGFLQKSDTATKNHKSKKDKRKIIFDCTDDEEVLPNTYKRRKLSTEESSLSSSNNVSATTDVPTPHTHTQFAQPYPSVMHLMDRILLLEERLLGTWSCTKTTVKEEQSEGTVQKKPDSKWSKTIGLKTDNGGEPLTSQVEVKYGQAKESEVIDDGLGGPQLWFHNPYDIV